MLTNRSITRPTLSRRTARRRTIVRRGWLVQRLEPRCVMASDVLGSEPDTSAWLDDSDIEIGDSTPSIVSTARPLTTIDELWESTVFDEPDVELHIDGVDDVLTDVEAHGRDDESSTVVDLLSTQAIEFEVRQHASVMFTWDPSQLDQLLPPGQSLAIHVEYDALRWQAPSHEPQAVDFDGAARLVENDVTDRTPLLFESTLTMVSLADQSVRIEIEVQPGNADEGTLPQIFIKLTDLNRSDVTDEKWTAEDFDWQGGLNTAMSIWPTERWDTQGSKIDEIVDDFLSGVKSSDKGDAGYPSTDNAMIGEENGGAQPLSEGDGAPLPESRRESVERGPRSARRTLDLRSSGPVIATVPPANRSAVTPDSLATQAAIASVYDAEPSTAVGQSRWLLDPKPARLQVATFLLSRSPEGSSVAVRRQDVRSIDQQSQSMAGTEKEATATTQTEMASPHVLTQSARVESTNAPATDASLTQVEPSIGETAVEAGDDVEEAAREPAVYAFMVDRVLGSPVSLVAILGLTVIARISDSEEVLQ